MSLFNHPCQKLYRETGFIKGAVAIATIFQSRFTNLCECYQRQCGKPETLKKSLGCLSGCVWWNLMK